MPFLRAGNLDGELIMQERTIKIAGALGIEAEAQKVGAGAASIPTLCRHTGSFLRT